MKGSNMQNIDEIIAAYEELKVVIDKRKELLKDDYDVRSILKTLKRLNIQRRFGVPLTEASPDWYHVGYQGSYGTYVGYFGEPYKRTISWPDSDQQPENEWLFVISFPTGGYIFGDEYPIETFREFFKELKGFGPKYCDTANKTLYFTEEVSAEVYSKFQGVFKKYKNMVQEELKRKRITELQKELEKLNGS
jgi:hypothetical protein